MPDIKVKETVHDIKVLDRSAVAAEHMKKAVIRAKDTAQNLMDDGQVTPEEYAEDKLRYAARDAADDAGHRMKHAAQKTKEKITSQRNKTQGAEKSGQHGDTGASSVGSRSAEASRKNARQRDTIPGQRRRSASRGESGSGSPRQMQRSIKTVGADKHTIKKAPEGSAKLSRFGANRGAGRSVKTSNNSGRITIKSTKHAAQSAEKAAKAAQKSARAAASMSRKAAMASKKIALASKQAIIKLIQAIIAAIQNLVAAISAGGGVSGMVIIVILMVALIVGSSFGIFFSSEDTGSDMTMQSVVREINDEYQAKIDAIKVENPHDELEMSGSSSVWREVLSVYAVKTNTDPENPQEVVTLDDGKVTLLKEIFWDMNEITSRTETKTEMVIKETDDGEGNIVEEETEETKTILYITVAHKTADEMADQYGFSEEQKLQMKELLDEKNRELWSAVLYGIHSAGDGEIASVALSQVGNYGGQPYWSWYGFGGNVPWCAIFVSWCANECGYIESGIIPKFASCDNGMAWFKERDQWIDRNEEPAPGMIIFFDWDNKYGAGPQDGSSDHVGIVVNVENGVVYTVEGNCSDYCHANQYSIGHYEIMGYGTPAY